MISRLMELLVIPSIFAVLCGALSYAFLTFLETPNNSQMPNIHKRPTRKKKQLAQQTKPQKLTAKQKAILNKYPMIMRFVSVFDGAECPVYPQTPIDRLTSTLYRFKPLDGVTMARIPKAGDFAVSAGLNLNDMKFKPVAEGGMVEIEVIKNEKELVLYKDLPKPKKINSPLVAPVGLTVDRKPAIVDLYNAPHILIGGSTGSGKTNALNTMMCQLISRYPVRQLRIIMSDGKGTELNLYDDVQHLLAPVITDPSGAVAAVNWCIDEMDRRNVLCKIQRVNHVNRLSPAMPYIILLLDELQDTILQIGQELSKPLQRLAAKARSAGIHIIATTQDPKAELLGPMRSNLPCRWAFKTATAGLSRVILDEGGAELLTGSGHSLLKSGGKTLELQAAYIDHPAEIDQILERHRGAPNYVAELLPDEEPQPTTIPANTQNEIDRVALICEQRMNDGVSANILNKQHGIPLATARKIIKELHDKGAISGPNGNKPRTVSHDYDFSQHRR